MVELQLPKLVARVRFPSLAPTPVVAQLGSAPRSGRGGREFKSPQPDKTKDPRDNPGVFGIFTQLLGVYLCLSPDVLGN